MNTLISGIFIYPGKVGGAENYFYNLLKGFRDLGYHRNSALLLQDDYRDRYDRIINQYESSFIRLKMSRVIYEHLFVFQNEIFRRSENIFFPNYVTPLLSSSKKRIFCSILDLQYLHYPDFFSRQKRAWLRYAHQFSLWKSRKVYCISDFVRRDILEKYGSKHEKKLIVTHIPVDFKRFEHNQNKSEEYNFPYILSVAAQYPHKNILTLLKAFNIFNKNHPEVKLILTGQIAKNLVGGNYSAYSAALDREISKNSNIFLKGYVEEATLGDLYRNAKLFVFPSLFEGFGIPCVEAMGMGIPTIVSDNTSLREVTLGKAIYLNDPLNPEEISEKMTAAFSNITALTKDYQLFSGIIREKYSVQNVSAKYSDIFQFKDGDRVPV